MVSHHLAFDGAAHCVRHFAAGGFFLTLALPSLLRRILACDAIVVRTVRM